MKGNVKEERDERKKDGTRVEARMRVRVSESVQIAINY